MKKINIRTVFDNKKFNQNNKTNKQVNEKFNWLKTNILSTTN